MKKIIFYAVLLAVAFSWAGCKKISNNTGGQISSYIPMLDLRKLYKGSDVTLNLENLAGSDKITGVVVSDYSGNNMPAANYLVIQDHRRLSVIRGISIPLGADAAKYVSGDSVIVSVVGGVLTRADGVLQIKNIPASAVTKVSSNNSLPTNRIPSSTILNDPTTYESTLVAIVKGGFDPIPTPTDKFGGDKLVNDGFQNITLHTEANATFADNSLPISANFFGIVFNTKNADGSFTPQIRLRKASDVQVLSSTIQTTPIVIAGFINDVEGTDANYEYIQMLATRDIDFAQTPYSLVTTNNAGASTPTGFPANGWATGDVRTYKFNMTTGTVKKGQFFYVGGTTKTINGSSSTSMSTSTWIRAFNYSTTAGDGFGTKTTNLLANSGNAFGMAVFEGTSVTKDSAPIDVVFVNTGGSLFSPGPPEVGYKIANTDFYDIINPITLQSQPYYREGSNTLSFTYTTPADQGFFYKLGGVYNPRLGRWVEARTQTIIDLSKKSTLDEIEGEFPVGTADEPGPKATALKD